MSEPLEARYVGSHPGYSWFGQVVTWGWYVNLSVIGRSRAAATRLAADVSRLRPADKREDAAILTGVGGAANIVTSSPLSTAPTGILATLNAVSGFVIYVGLALLPVAIGIAVLRYRLYEIDRLISRTISWAFVTATVGGLFIGVILVFQAALAPPTHSNELAVAGSTLVAFALFAPIRRRVQRLVDRRFNRSRYDAERTIAAFAGHLRDEVDLETLRAEILTTVSAAVEPSSVSLWMRN